MSENTLNARSAGETITAAFFNDIRSAISTAFVGRNSAGVPTAGQDLGSVSTPWGTVRATSMVVNGQSIDPTLVGAPPNRVKSGKKRSSSNQPAFLTPNGAALSIVIDATPTPLTLDINGTDVSVSADITITGLTAAPSSQNTALVNDTFAADQHDTRLWGEPEHYKSITIDTVGTNITALVGKYAAFMIDNGSSTEYFFAFVESTTKLSKIRRGFFYDSSLNPKNRIFFSNNDTITLLKSGFIFVENDGVTTDVSYTVPTYSAVAPAAPATGDYWYDLANSLWKRYDGASFQIINRTLVGMFVNTTTACVGARCEDFFANVQATNDLEIEKVSTEIARSVKQNGKVSVAGMDIDFGTSLPTWNITTNLASSDDMYDASEQASRMYYLYVKDTGAVVISDISPYFRQDLLGEYHPHNPWRCVGLMYNDAGSDVSVAGGIAPGSKSETRAYGDSTNIIGTTYTSVLSFRTVDYNAGALVVYVDSLTLGTSFVAYWPCKAMGWLQGVKSTDTVKVGWAKNQDLATNGTTGGLSRTVGGAMLSFGYQINARVAQADFDTEVKIGDVLSPMTQTGSDNVDDNTSNSNVYVLAEV